MRMRDGIGVVELGDLGGLDRARRQHGVRAADDGRLGLGPVMGRVGFDTSSGLDSALTRSRVWKVDTSGRLSWCLMRVAGHARYSQ